MSDPGSVGPTTTEVVGVFGGLSTIVGIFFAIWRGQAKTKRGVAEDNLGVAESKSKVDWLKTTGDRAELAIAARDHALEQHRGALGEIVTLKTRVVLLREGHERRDRRIRRLTGLLLEARPDLADAFDSLPGDFDETPSVSFPDLSNDEESKP